MRRRQLTFIVAAALSFAVEVSGHAPPGQASPPDAQPETTTATRAPQSPAAARIDSAALERGQGLYTVNCASCHGSGARGGETGPNLLRSPFLLDDQNGETLLSVIRAGRPDRGMPARPDLSESQIKEIAVFLHSLRTTGRDPGRNRPATIVTGDAAAGRTYFAATCARCHSATADLRGIASKYADPRQLQQVWLVGTAAGGRGAPANAQRRAITITVTLPSGETVEGAQARLDDFTVSLLLPDGSTRTFLRNGDVPKVDVHDPLQAHRDLVPTYTDRAIHDVTAYLVTLK